MKTVSTVAEYIAGFPPATRKKLTEMRALIKKNAPEAEEGISYMMPAYKLNGMLVYFAGYKNHIGFYPGSRGISQFQKAIEKFKHAKGSVQFPLDQPIPVKLVEDIVKFRRRENLSKEKKPTGRKS